MLRSSASLKERTALTDEITGGVELSNDVKFF